MSPQSPSTLSRRERQVLEIIHRRQRASVADILDELPDALTDGAVRSVLRLLRQKKLVKDVLEGRRRVYQPAARAGSLGTGALAEVVRNFFRGSREQAVAALLDLPGEITPEEYQRLRALIDAAAEDREP